MSAFSLRKSDNFVVDVGEPRIYIPEGHYSSAKELYDAMKNAWVQTWMRYKSKLSERKITVLSREQKTKVPAGTDLTFLERATTEREDENTVPSVDQSSLRFDFSEKTHKMKFLLTSNAHELSFSPALADILAIMKPRNPNELHMTSQTEIDVQRGCHFLFVYTDIVQDSIVGDIKAPLLRSVIARGQYGENVRDIFTKPMYIPLKSNYFDTCRISIKDETGSPVKFNYGTTSVTLHFRRIARNNLD